MQTLVAPPRSNILTDPALVYASNPTAWVMEGLTRSDKVNYSFGLELLQPGGGASLDAIPLAQSDITGSLVLGQTNQVARDCYATVHGTAQFGLDVDLNWGVDMVRPYVDVTSPPYLSPYTKAVYSGPALTLRYHLGCYVVTTPQIVLGHDRVRSVVGFDPLYFLNLPIGDTYTVKAGSQYLGSINTLIYKSGTPWLGVLIADNAKLLQTTASTQVWPLDSSHAATTYLNVINDLLAAIGYQGLWCDQDGNYRAHPYQHPHTRHVEFTLGTVMGSYESRPGYWYSQGHALPVQSGPQTWQTASTVADDGRTRAYDTFGQPNWWRFIQNNLTAAPVEGNGQYTVQDILGGATSQAVLGRVVRAPVQYVDASSQNDLRSQGDASVVAAKSINEIIVFNSVPLPIAQHFDILLYRDDTLPDEPQRKVMAQSWTLPMNGQDMTWTTKVVAQS